MTDPNAPSGSPPDSPEVETAALDPNPERESGAGVVASVKGGVKAGAGAVGRGITNVGKGVAGAGKTAANATVVGYWKGLTYPFRGAKFVYLQHPGLIKYWIWPILITLIVLGLVFFSAYEYHAALVDLVWEPPEGEGFWTGVASFFHGFVEVLVGLLMVIVGAFVVSALTTIVAAPFNDALSEEVEFRAIGKKGPPFQLGAMLKDIVRTVLQEVMKIIMYLVVMVPLFILSLVFPGVGQVVYSVFGFLFTAMYFAIDYVDWPAVRRGKSVTHRVNLAWKKFMPMFGFGTGVWLFLFIPIVNLFFMPAAVAGGTLLYLDLVGEADDTGA